MRDAGAKLLVLLLLLGAAVSPAVAEVSVELDGGNYAGFLMSGGGEDPTPWPWSKTRNHVDDDLLLNPTAARNNLSMMEFIKQDGIEIGSFETWEWEKKSWEHMSRAEAEELMTALGRFFMNHTKDELLKLATENRFQLGPCNNAADALKYPQLQARDFWQDIEHPELGATLKYPGGAVKTTQGYVGPKRRAPRIGEHNGEVYEGLGLFADDLASLKRQGVI